MLTLRHRLGQRHRATLAAAVRVVCGCRRSESAASRMTEGNCVTHARRRFRAREAPRLTPSI